MKLFRRGGIICQVCKKEIENDIDQYGLFGDEICRGCHFKLLEECDDGDDYWYGMAPHGHDMNITGIFIGSTVFKPLPETKDANGRYWIEDQKAWFTPDDEVDGAQGIWE